MKVILEGIVGSTVHGTSVQDGLEDLDIMAVGIEEPKKILGFYQEDCIVSRDKPVGVRSEAGDVDHTLYGLRKFLNLALKCNPSILLLFFVPEDKILKITEEGRELRLLINDIVSTQAYAPFKGYMRQQHERLLGLRGQRNVTRPELVDAYGYDTKYAGHIIRLGFQGEEFLLTGKIPLPMKDEKRKVVVDVRTGKYTLPEVSNLIIEAEDRLNRALEQSILPKNPNRKKVENWMINKYLNSFNAVKRT